MTPLTIQIAREFGTPAAVVDLDIVERNIKRLQSACDASGIANRPHIKTHKSPVLAAMQRDAGAKGITCQKLGEAEVMAQAGFDDILICYNILGEEKTARLSRLLQRAQITVCVDNPVPLPGLAFAAAVAKRRLGVLVECDTGRQRAGVQTPAEAVSLAREIAKVPWLEYSGLMFYAPETALHATQKFLDEALSGLAASGLRAAIVSTGGTPDVRNLGSLVGATEHRAGTYIFNDRMMMASAGATLDDCALTVLSTVVSRPSAHRGILDAGSKTLTADTGLGLDGHGTILECPGARIAGLAEEHGILDLSRCVRAPAIGDLVSIIPNHVCVVVNMLDRLVAVRGNDIVGEIPVAARGRIS